MLSDGDLYGQSIIRTVASASREETSEWDDENHGTIYTRPLALETLKIE